ncbi:MAG TPA: hypothetical protein VKI00_12190 [Mycobacterium sp.]|uniref:hypothetical protein n=1 Tax=Mycobacterium sp. TaxID=1785 RepID=UPI002C2268D4|nr:hypothetical protein [Mycobacterium sp.]HME76373.1 hypothetical protein [Mycobacterium sp.]
MDLNAPSGLIKAFFDVYQELTVIGIVLPTGWFGKPYDNYYSLISIDIDSEAGKLSLDLTRDVLSFEPMNAKLNESRRELVVGVQSGEMMAIGGTQRFGSGEVVFCVPEDPYGSAALEASSQLR